MQMQCTTINFDRLTVVVSHKICKAAMPIISKFTARTNGSYVKLSHSSIGWSYYSCDPEWGSLQASYLVAELGEALQSFDVRFVALKGIVEGKCNVHTTSCCIYVTP